MSVGSVNTWTSSVRPDLIEPEHFGRTNGKGTWYCAACTTEALAHLFSFDPAGAEAHEHSPAHVARVSALKTSWMLGDLPPDEAAWEIVPETPYADVRAREKKCSVDVYADSAVRRRVLAWMRECALAQGGTWEHYEDASDAAEMEVEDEEDEDEESEDPHTVTTQTTDELPAAVSPSPPVENHLILDSDTSDTATDSDDAKAAALRSVVAEDHTHPRVTYEVKTLRISQDMSRVKLSRDAFRWILRPAQKSISRLTRLLPKHRN